MIMRVLSIAVAIGATLALWFGYAELRFFRGTVLWEYRFIVFAIAAFLGLSLLEWTLGWIKSKTQSADDDH